MLGKNVLRPTPRALPCSAGLSRDWRRVLPGRGTQHRDVTESCIATLSRCRSRSSLPCGGPNGPCLHDGGGGGQPPQKCHLVAALVVLSGDFKASRWRAGGSGFGKSPPARSIVITRVAPTRKRAHLPILPEPRLKRFPARPIHAHRVGGAGSQSADGVHLCQLVHCHGAVLAANPHLAVPKTSLDRGEGCVIRWD